MKTLRIVFMGTPEFAVHSLDKIAQSHHQLQAVVTAPDKPAGRGRKLQKSAVKKYAEENSLTLWQPEKLRAPEFIAKLTNLQPDLIVVVAFRMLPEVVWRIPHIGTINLHASLLPQYRGAAPINWAIINGERESGVTTFFINDEIDTGSILLQSKLPIAADETAGTLHDKLMHVGADLVLETLNGLAEGQLKSIPQKDSADLKRAPKLFRDDCRIDWNQQGIQIERHIRGLSPFPGAFTIVQSGELAGQLKILEATFVATHPEHAPGTLFFKGKEAHVSVPDGYLNITQMQAQGKRRMHTSDVYNGLQNNQMSALCSF
jgi:methionyl-tRNA formyltransferase